MEYKHIFGPVPSRRLGISLGIDIITKKTCNLDCVYCEVGKTTNYTIIRDEYIDLDEIKSEITHYFKYNNCILDYITFAGSGEPMLNNKIGEIIKYIRSITDTKIALITNGILFTNSKIIDEIVDVDVIIPSLDAVFQETFNKINRPYENIKIDEIIKGLILLRDKYLKQIFLEIFIIDGINNSKEELDYFKEVLLKIKPDKIELNSLDRPPVENWVKKTDISILQEIKNYWNIENVVIIDKYKNRKEVCAYSDLKEKTILNMLSIRPCTVEDISNITGINVLEINKYLDILENFKLIESVKNERGVFIKLK